MDKGRERERRGEKIINLFPSGWIVKCIIVDKQTNKQTNKANQIYREN